MIPVKEFTADKYLIMATKQGIIKKTDLTEYDTSRKNGIIAINLREEDELINVRLVEEDQEIVMGTKCGYAIRFNSEEVRPISRTSIGVRGIELREDDVVVGMDIVKEDLFVLCVSENGYGKLSASDLYRPQKRGGKGVQTYKVTKKTGELVGFCVIDRDGEIMMINNQGVVIKLEGNDISAVGRNTQGVRLMKLNPEESIATISKVYKEDPVDDNEESDENQMTLIETTEKE
jgi:DNA gyrase subunit A